MARQSKSVRAAAAATKQNTAANAAATGSAGDIKNAKMDAVVDLFKTYDDSQARLKLGLVLLKAAPGIIPSVEEFLILTRLLAEARVVRARPGFAPDTLRRGRVPLKEATSKKLRAAYQSNRERFLASLEGADTANSQSPKPASAEHNTTSLENSPRPSSIPVTKTASTTPQNSPKKAAAAERTPKSTPTKAQPPVVSTPKNATPKTARAASSLKPTEAQIPMVLTPEVSEPLVESPSPATKIFAAESTKFKTRRNKKTKVPASPSPVKQSKEQTSPAVQSSEFGFRSTLLPIKTLPEVTAIVLLTLATINHTRNVSDSSSGPIFVGRSRNDSSSSSDEDKLSTGKTTPHRLSDASDKPLDILKEFAPEPIVDAKSTVSGDEPSLDADETNAESVTEVLTEAPAEESLAETTPAEIAANEEAVLPSADEALLAAVADDTIPLFFERAYGGSLSTKEDLRTSVGTFGKTVQMVQQIVNTSAVIYLAGDMIPNIRLVNSLNVYNHSALPRMILSSEQVVEQAAFDLAMSKHRDDLIRLAVQEEEADQEVKVEAEEEVLVEEVIEEVPEVVAPLKSPQTNADDQMGALFAIGLQSVFKNGTWFPNPSFKPFKPVVCMNIDEDPAIVTMVASLPSGTGLVATLAQLGSDRPLASWPKFTPSTTLMVEAPVDGLEAAIARLCAREATKVAAQPVVERAALNAAAPIFTAPEVEANAEVIPLKDSPMDGSFTKEVSTIEAPITKEPATEAVEAPVAAAIAPIVAAVRAPPKPSKAPKVSKTVAKMTGPRDNKSLSKKEKRAMKKAGLL